MSSSKSNKLVDKFAIIHQQTTQLQKMQPNNTSAKCTALTSEGSQIFTHLCGILQADILNSILSMR
jgi:hypothetical protein